MSAREEDASGAPRARTCPARSPETDSPCALPDTWRAHDTAHGCHESAIVDSARAVWPARWNDLKRWLDEPGAVAQYVAGEDARHGTHEKPRRGCPSCVGERRVQSALHVVEQLHSTEVPDVDSLIRFVLAADDITRPTPGIFATGGLLPGQPANGPVIFGGAPAPLAMLDEAALYTARMRRERGQ